MATSKEEIRKLLLNMGRPLSTRELWNMQRLLNVVKSDMTNNVSNVGRRVSKTAIEARHPKSVNKAKKEYKKLERERLLEQWRTAGGNIGPSPTRTEYEKLQRQNAANLQLWQQQKEQLNQETAERIAGVTSLISPSQWLPTLLGKNVLPGAENNYGLASALMSPIAAERFNKEHPYINTAFNVAADLATPYALSKIPQGISTLRNTFGILQGGLRIGNTVYKPDLNALNSSIGGIKLKAVPAMSTQETLRLTRDQIELLPSIFKDVPSNIKLIGAMRLGNNIIPLGEVVTNEGKVLKSIMNKRAIPEDKWNVGLKTINKTIENRNIPLEVKNLKDKYGFDFSAKSWFVHRPKFALPTKEDISIFYQHMPEYEKIADDLINNNTMYKDGKHWYGPVWDGHNENTFSLRLIDPEAYIVSHSKDFLNNGYVYHNTNQMHTTTPKLAQDFANTSATKNQPASAMTTDSGIQEGIYQQQRHNGPIFSSIVGKEKGAKIIDIIDKPHETYVTGNTVGNYPKPVGLATRPDIVGNWRQFGPEVFRKSVRGNNGNFSGPGLYNSFIPIGIASPFIYDHFNDNLNETHY